MNVIASYKNNSSKLVNILVSNKSYIVCCLINKIIFLDDDFVLKNEIDLSIGNQQQISCCCISYNKQTNEELLWIGSANDGFMTVWDLNSFELVMRIALDDCNGYRSMICVKEMVGFLFLFVF
jgi:hypothetical protein